MKNDENNNLLLRIKDLLIRKFEICKKLITESTSRLQQDAEISDYESEDGIGGSNNSVSTLQDELIGDGDISDIEDEDDIDISSDSLENAIVSCNKVLRFLQLL
jgi:hypothetical protein